MPENKQNDNFGYPYQKLQDLICKYNFSTKKQLEETKIPYDCIAVVLKNQIVSGNEIVSLRDLECLQIIDVRQMYQFLLSLISRGQALDSELMNQKRQETILMDQIADLQLRAKQDQVNQQNYLEQIQQYQKKQSEQVNTICQLQSTVINHTSDINKKQKIIHDKEGIIQSLNIENQKLQNQIDGHIYQISIIQQQLNLIIQEFEYTFGHQYHQGIFNDIKQVITQQNNKIQEYDIQIKNLFQQSEKQAEQADKKIKEAESKFKQIKTEMNEKDQEFYDQINYAQSRQQQEIDGLKQKLRQQEEELDLKIQDEEGKEDLRLQYQNCLLKELKEKIKNLEEENTQLRVSANQLQISLEQQQMKQNLQSNSIDDTFIVDSYISKNEKLEQQQKRIFEVPSEVDQNYSSIIINFLDNDNVRNFQNRKFN